MSEAKIPNPKQTQFPRHHHRAVHEGGFGVRMGADGQPEFTDRQGRHIPEAPKARFRGNAIALMT